MGRTQHHTVLSLERSLSISAVGYLQSCFGRQLCQGMCCLRAYFSTYILFYAQRLRMLRAFLLQPVACQQVVGFCLAIWVYAGVIAQIAKLWGSYFK